MGRPPACHPHLFFVEYFSSLLLTHRTKENIDFIYRLGLCSCFHFCRIRRYNFTVSISFRWSRTLFQWTVLGKRKYPQPNLLYDLSAFSCTTAGCLELSGGLSSVWNGTWSPVQYTTLVSSTTIRCTACTRRSYTRGEQSSLPPCDGQSTRPEMFTLHLPRTSRSNSVSHDEVLDFPSASHILCCLKSIHDVLPLWPKYSASWSKRFLLSYIYMKRYNGDLIPILLCSYPEIRANSITDISRVFCCLVPSLT